MNEALLFGAIIAFSILLELRFRGVWKALDAQQKHTIALSDTLCSLVDTYRKDAKTKEQLERVTTARCSKRKEQA